MGGVDRLLIASIQRLHININISFRLRSSRRFTLLVYSRYSKATVHWSAITTGVWLFVTCICSVISPIIWILSVISFYRNLTYARLSSNFLKHRFMFSRSTVAGGRQCMAVTLLVFSTVGLHYYSWSRIDSSTCYTCIELCVLALQRLIDYNIDY